VTHRRWTYGIRLVMPAEHLKKLSMNRLIIDNTRNPPHADSWEIYDLRLLQEVLPKADPVEAARQFELARRAWEARQVEPKNLAIALERARGARDLLERAEVKPDLYQEILALLERVDAELTQRFEEGMFSARRAQRVGRDWDRARAALKQTMRYFDSSDYRYRELKRYYEALSEPSRRR